MAKPTTPKEDRAESAEQPRPVSPSEENDHGEDGAAASAAIAEVEAADAPTIIEFRGVTFEIDSAARASARYAIALASNNHHVAIVELIGPESVTRFISACERGEKFSDVATEFFDVLAKASGQGNS